MSLAAAHFSKRARYSCQSCRDRKARFSHGGSVRADRDHTLCFECFRRERERQRAKRLVQASTETRVWDRPLSERQRAHREGMLAHLTRQRGSMMNDRPPRQPRRESDGTHATPLQALPADESFSSRCSPKA